MPSHRVSPRASSVLSIESSSGDDRPSPAYVDIQLDAVSHNNWRVRLSAADAFTSSDYVPRDWFDCKPF